MKILLIDADSTIPNIALMKLSTWHKKKGDDVLLVRAKIPYYPNKIKRKFVVPDGFDKVYCSVVFDGNKDFICGNNITFGGTGADIKIKLPGDIENEELDYSLYPDNDISYGFITRGCIRKCSFCKVPEKEGYIHKVAEIEDIVRHKKVKFLDNNILAYPRHMEILAELVKKQINCQFNQGLDIRLINGKNSELLSKVNYLGDYIFAFDDWKYRKVIDEKLLLLSWRKPFQFKFFVYIHPEMELSNIVNRIVWLKEKQCLPYIMRDISCWESNCSNFYTDLAAYCNQVHLFKKMNFYEFLDKRHTNKNRVLNSEKLWELGVQF